MHNSDATADAEQLSGTVDAQMQAQILHIDHMTRSMSEARKESTGNAETIQTLLISIENLSESF